MADKATPNIETTTPTETPTNTDVFQKMQRVGFANFLGAGQDLAEAMSDMGVEFLNFFAERVKEDVKTQHKILHCKNVGELQHIQAQFVQRAIEQYQDEAGKIVAMSSNLLNSGNSKKDN